MIRSLFRRHAALRIADHGRAGRHIARDDGARPHHRALADAHAAQDGGPGADRGIVLDPGLGQRPVPGPLGGAIVVAGPRGAVVDERDPVPDEHPVGDVDARADEGVGRDLAMVADRYAALDLDERADPRVRADTTPVQVHELVDCRALTDYHIRRERLEPLRHVRQYNVGVYRLLAVCIVGLASSGSAAAATVHGLVYDDANHDGQPSLGEPGVGNAVVA